MTNEQKIRIATLRRSGQGYTAIARELGLSKSAISNYCQKNGLGNIVAETGKKDLLKGTVKNLSQRYCQESFAKWLAVW